MSSSVILLLGSSAKSVPRERERGVGRVVVEEMKDKMCVCERKRGRE